MKRPIYLDNNATTPVDPRVLEAMMPYLTTSFGNASSRNHLYGWEAEAAVEQAREQVAAAMGAEAKEIIFTSGATESDNLAILGAARAHRKRGDHIVTCETEHDAVLDSCRELEREGFSVTYLSPRKDGRIETEQVRSAMTEQTILVSLMLGNNEIGTIHPLAEIGRICREKDVLFHTDAVQGFGKISFDVNEACVDLASVTAHKLYGPKGAGALYIRSRRPPLRVVPLLHGGGQERGVRSGTLNVPGIVGLGKASELAASEHEEEAARLRCLRSRLWSSLSDRLGGITLNGTPLPETDPRGRLLGPEARLPGSLNVSFEGVEGESLLSSLKEIAVSSGSACTSAAVKPSHVLTAIGVPELLARATIRFGIGRFNTEEEIDTAAGLVTESAIRLRNSLGGTLEARRAR